MSRPHPATRGVCPLPPPRPILTHLAPYAPTTSSMSVIDATALAIVALSAIAIAVALAATVLAADAFAAAL